jgi:hypothetical protein
MKENWKIGNIPTTVITDSEDGFPINTGHTGSQAHEYYGGNLVCESIARRNDALLISAAPDLLEACKSVMKSKRGEHLPVEVVVKLADAIYKAETVTKAEEIDDADDITEVDFEDNES